MDDIFVVAMSNYKCHNLHYKFYVTDLLLCITTRHYV